MGLVHLLETLICPGIVLGICLLIGLPWLLEKDARLRRRNRIVIWVVGVAAGVLAWIASVPLVASSWAANNLAACASHIKQLDVAVLTYSADFDDRLPDARRWNDLTDRYGVDRDALECPVAGRPFCYAMNASLSLVSLTEISDPNTTVLVFECDAGRRNACGGPAMASTCTWHGRPRFAFADGQSSWMIPDAEHPLLWEPTAEPEK